MNKARPTLFMFTDSGYSVLGQLKPLLKVYFISCKNARREVTHQLKEFVNA